MASCQTTGFFESLLRLVRLNKGGRDFSKLSRRQKPQRVNIPCRRNLAVGLRTVYAAAILDV